MSNCSNSFEASMNNKMRQLVRPFTHRPHSKSRQRLSPSIKPFEKYTIIVKHQKSLTKPFLNQSLEQHKKDEFNAMNKCTTQEDIQSQQNIRNQRRKVLKNVNQSAKAIRPSVPKKISANNLVSIVNTKPIKHLNLVSILSQNRQQKDQQITERKRPQPQQNLLVPPIMSMIKTRQIKSPRCQSPNILHQTVKHRLMGYKIAQSKVILPSQGTQQLRIQQSILDQRDFISNFMILKDFQMNENFSQHIVIQKQLVSSSNIQEISTEQSVYSILNNQHPNILHLYQGILNGQTQYLFLRQFYENFLKYQLLNCEDFKRYLKNILMIVHELSKKRIWYQSNLYDNIVISRNVCKLMNFNNCKIGQSQWQLRNKYKVMVRNIIDIMVNQVNEIDLIKDKKFKQFLLTFQKSKDFMQVLTHKYLIETSTFYII